MINLSLTFRGPFLLVVPPYDGNGSLSKWITIYAPKCEGHSASVFWGDGAAHLFGRAHLGGKFPYRLTGPNANDGDISYQWNADLSPTNPILSPDTSGPPQRYKMNLWDAYFGISVPRPLVYYATDLIEDTEVVQQGDCKNDFSQRWATGFRLYYHWSHHRRLELFPSEIPPGSSTEPIDVTPPVGKSYEQYPDWHSLPESGDIEFQYESSGGDDLEHRDAASCFEQITKLIGLNWWLNFNNGAVPGGSAVHTGGDCEAVPMVVGINN